jgi:hypothetical protein
LHLNQISSPVQPVRRRSFGSEEDYFASAKRISSPAIVEDFASDEEEEEDGQSLLEKASIYMEKTLGDHSPRSKVRFSPDVCSSPRSKKIFVPMRMHSAPITSLIRREDDDESALLASIRRRKPFIPGSALRKTEIATTKTGATTRLRTNSTTRSNNRDIIKPAFLEHGCEGEDSSIGSLKKKSMLYILPPAPSLDTPPEVKKKKSRRRTLMPPVVPALDVVAQPQQTTKTKRSSRRSIMQDSTINI